MNLNLSGLTTYTTPRDITEVEARMKAIFSKLNPTLQALELQGLALGDDGEVHRTAMHGAAAVEVA